MRVGFHTFGCKLNQYETESLARPFSERGFTLVPASQEADIYLINTCTVTARADQKARGLIRSVARRRPESLVIVTGCSAQLEAAGLSALAPNVAVVPQSEKSILLKLPALFSAEGPSLTPAEAMKVLQARGGGETGSGDPFGARPGALAFHTRAYLKIQDGCDSRCAYCRVPLARGPSVCLEPGEVVRRAVELETLGFREIVLTGVNISSYASGGAGLVRLLEALLRQTSVPRYRLTSVEPEAVSEDLARVVSSSRVCPHFHISVQSGSDAVLLRMRRRYNAARVREGIALLRQAAGDPFLAADLLVGFPGETEKDFQATRRLADSAGFAALHVFPFSPRPGTEGAGLPDPVPERIRDERAAVLSALSRELSLSYGARWAGREAEVLLQGPGKRGETGWTGVSSNYLKVSVRGVPSEADARGRIARVRISPGGKVPGSAGFSGDFLGFV